MTPYFGNSNRLLGLLAAFVLMAMMSAAQEGYVVKSVDPDYSDFTGDTFVEPSRVTLAVFRDGAPFSIESEVALPHAVVQAIRESEFITAETAYAIVYSIPVNRRLSDYTPSASSFGARAGGTPIDELLKDVDKWDADEVQKKEDRLKNDEKSVDDRIRLLLYASVHADDPDAIGLTGLRHRQLAWLIEHDPTNPILNMPVALMNRDTGPLADMEAFDALQGQWLAALIRNPANPVVLRTVANGLGINQPELLERQLMPYVNTTSTAGALLGELYANAALGVRARDLKNGRAVLADDSLPQGEFALKARAEILNSSDVRFLYAALDKIRDSGVGLVERGSLPTGFSEFCSSALENMQKLRPDYMVDCEPSVETSTPATVTPAEIKKQTRPTYPAGAKNRGIQGKVVFRAIIGVDGKLKNLGLLSGPFELYDESLRVVSQWEYEPTRIDGEPVEVVTEMEVNYQLN